MRSSRYIKHIEQGHKNIMISIRYLCTLIMLLVASLLLSSFSKMHTKNTFVFNSDNNLQCGKLKIILSYIMELGLKINY